MAAQKSLLLLAAIFAAARSQAPVARYLRGEGREDEEAPALHYFATDPEWKYERCENWAWRVPSSV